MGFDRLREIPPYDEDEEGRQPEAVLALREAIAGADAVLVATPEYNHSIPGHLKNALDWISRPLADSPLRGKPAAVIGASTGMFGAVWAQAEAAQGAGRARRTVLDRELPVPMVEEQFAERRRAARRRGARAGDRGPAGRAGRHGASSRAGRLAPYRPRTWLAALAHVRAPAGGDHLDDLPPHLGHGSPARRWTRNCSWKEPRAPSGWRKSRSRRRRRRPRRAAPRPPRRAVARAGHGSAAPPGATGGCALERAPRRRRCCPPRRPAAGRAGRP